MPLTPEDVSNKRFTPVRLREGYDMGEVDHFLDEVEKELARLTRENNDLRSKLTFAQQGGASTTKSTPAKAKAPASAEAAEPTPTPAPPVPAESLDLIKVHTAADASKAAVRLLEIATRNADELVAEAREDAEQIVGESRTEAERMDAEARSRSESLDTETVQRRKQLFGDLDREKDTLNAEVQNLRAFEREYRSRLRSYFQQQLGALDGDGEAGTLNSDDHEPTRLKSMLGDEETARTK